MVQTLTQGRVERTQLDKQRRFVELYLHLSKNFRELRANPEIKKRIEDIFTSTINEFAPNLEGFQIYDLGLTQPTLRDNLLQNKKIVDYIGSQGWDKSVYCSNLARTIAEGYAYYFQRQTTPKSMWQRNTSQ